MQLASLLRGMLVLLLAALIAGALLISSTVVQSNIHTFLGPNGTEYVALQWATQLQWQPPLPGPTAPLSGSGSERRGWMGAMAWCRS